MTTRQALETIIKMCPTAMLQESTHTNVKRVVLSRSRRVEVCGQNWESVIAELRHVQQNFRI